LSVGKNVLIQDCHDGRRGDPSASREAFPHPSVFDVLRYGKFEVFIPARPEYLDICASGNLFLMALAPSTTWQAMASAAGEAGKSRMPHSLLFVDVSIRISHFAAGSEQNGSKNGCDSHTLLLGPSARAAAQAQQRLAGSEFRTQTR